MATKNGNNYCRAITNIKLNMPSRAPTDIFRPHHFTHSSLWYIIYHVLIPSLMQSYIPIISYSMGAICIFWQLPRLPHDQNSLCMRLWSTPTSNDHHTVHTGSTGCAAALFTIHAVFNIKKTERHSGGSLFVLSTWRNRCPVAVFQPMVHTYILLERVQPFNVVL